MGIITIEKSNHLYWLGRYIERVFTSLKIYEEYFDIILDKDKEIFHSLCKKLDIKDNYLNDAHFITSYLYDYKNQDSIYASCMKAYDNAITLRETLGSETLSFIQVIINIFEKMDMSTSPLIEVQQIKDNIYAFWGSIDENVDSELCRSIIKAGKYGERIDLYYRLGINENEIKIAHHKLNNRLESIEKIYKLDDLLHFSKEDNYHDLLIKLTNVFEVKYE